MTAGFEPTKMSLVQSVTTVAHNSNVICVTPWKVYRIPSPRSNIMLRTDRWTFTGIQQVGSGSTAKLVLAALSTTDPRDIELAALFAASIPITITVQFATMMFNDLVVSLQP